MMNFLEKYHRALHFIGGAIVYLIAWHFGGDLNVLLSLCAVCAIGGLKEMFDYLNGGGGDATDFLWTLAGSAIPFLINILVLVYS
jgi:hypothetical protein